MDRIDNALIERIHKAGADDAHANLVRASEWQNEKRQVITEIDYAALRSHPALTEALREFAYDVWRKGYMAGWEDRHADEHDQLPAGEQYNAPNPYEKV